MTWHLGIYCPKCSKTIVRELQCARDVEVTWTPGPGAEPGPRGVVPGREETYPAEGEPIGRDEL